MTKAVAPHGYLKKLLAHEEKVLLIGHQHWLVLAGHIFGALVFVLLVLVGVSAVWFYQGQAHPEVAYGYALAALALPTLWWRILSWRNHEYVVSTRRIIQLSGVFNKDVIDSAIDKITDLRTDQTLLGRILGYGDVEVLTASEAGKNAIRMIAKPLEFKRAMLDAQDALSGRGAAA